MHKENHRFPSVVLDKIQNLIQAKRLLYFSDLTVKQIAETLGFENHSYFSRFFSKETGMTALTFRKQFQNLKKKS
jgi:AraC family transcriptional activator of pobA